MTAKDVFEQATPQPGGYREAGPEMLSAAGATSGENPPRIVDVREPHEFTGELGHVPGAELVPMTSVPEAARSWDPKQTHLLVCRSGRRSANVASYLASQGFARVINLTGGMLAYNKLGLPRE